MGTYTLYTAGLFLGKQKYMVDQMQTQSNQYYINALRLLLTEFLSHPFDTHPQTVFQHVSAVIHVKQMCRNATALHMVKTD